MKPLLVLDVDETLIHSDIMEHEGLSSDFTFDKYFTCKRPGLDSFLAFCFDNFNVAIWSTGGSEYIAHILKNITPPDCKYKFVHTSLHCTHIPLIQGLYDHVPRYSIKKDITSVFKKFDKDDIVIVDDLPDVYMNQSDMVIQIRPYHAEVIDTELFINSR